MVLFSWLFSWCVIIGVLAFLFYCPIIKPWFGFRRPKGHNGKWFT